MNLATFLKVVDRAARLTLLMTCLLMVAEPSSAQRQTATRPLAKSAAAAAPRLLPANTQSPSSNNPFDRFEEAARAGQTYKVDFVRTELDSRAAATAEVAVRGQTLLVRMRAKDVPVPQSFDVPRYALWVYVPNYAVKMFIGDLPIIPTSRTRASSANESNQPETANRNVVRGDSDSAYLYTSLPPDAVFGGLAVTAEPVRFTQIVNEALRPLLVGLMPKETAPGMIAATTLYSGPIPNKSSSSAGQATTTTPQQQQQNQ